MTETTFRDYQAAEAQAYAEHRTAVYSDGLYKTIFDWHRKNKGAFNLLVDVGCGPRIQTLVEEFGTGIGVDPSAAMISQAKLSHFTSKTGEVVKFYVGQAESCDEAANLSENSVDMVTAAMAAHWFDMPKFWKTMNRIVRQNGTVALWTCSSLYCHPSTPNAKRVQEILFHLERDILKPFETPGNNLSRDYYNDLIMPWGECDGFQEVKFQKIIWDKDGVPSNANGQYLDGNTPTPLETLANQLASASMVQRWRAANAKLRNPKEDCVDETIKNIRQALDGKNELVLAGATVLLLFTKS